MGGLGAIPQNHHGCQARLGLSATEYSLAEAKGAAAANPTLEPVWECQQTVCSTLLPVTTEDGAEPCRAVVVEAEERMSS